MFISKLNTIRNSLTPAEVKIANYIQNNLSQLKTITSQELAEEIGIAQSTIIRFSKKLGYGSFRELLVDLAAQEKDELISEEIKIKEPNADTIKKICLQVQEIAQITADINDAMTLEKAANLIQRSKSHIIFGIGSSNLFAEYFSNQLIKMGISCYTSTSAHTIYSLIDNAAKDTVIILISETGETKEIVKAAALAKEKGLQIIAMTRGVNNPLHEYADILLKTVTFETETRLNVTTMRCSQLFLIDVLYLLILKSDFKSKNKIISRSNQLID